ncbi:MAG: hypothetical protein AUJ07_09375 [Crenarchaeota archaeon 13_1_40CM_3_53_5]|nr:MAG: hypothetical protein AUJ07_09375 [Crenarchaeota archaeon 13_1_40CM_3_53_5]
MQHSQVKKDLETCPTCTKGNGSPHGLARTIRNAIGFARTRKGKPIDAPPMKLRRLSNSLNPNTIGLSSVELERKRNGPFLNNLRSQVR